MGFSMFCTLFCSCSHVLFLHEAERTFSGSETFCTALRNGSKSKAVVHGPVWPTSGQIWSLLTSFSDPKASVRTCNYEIDFLVSLELEFRAQNFLVNCDKITSSRDKIWIPNSAWMCLYRTKIQIDEIFRTIWESSGAVVPFTR